MESDNKFWKEKLQRDINKTEVETIYQNASSSEFSTSSAVASYFKENEGKSVKALEKPDIFLKPPNSGQWTEFPKIVPKETASSILRQNLAYRNQELKAQEKVNDLLNRGIAHGLDYERRMKDLEVKSLQTEKAEEAKKLLKAKLAYERAIAASRDMVHRKQLVANEARTEEQKLKDQLSIKKQLEMERLKAQANSIQNEILDSKRAVLDFQKEKSKKAEFLKNEKLRLLSEVKAREEQEIMNRKIRIQQIQATKEGNNKLKEAESRHKTALIVKKQNEALNKISKEAAQAQLEATRQRIKEIKRQKTEKLHHASKEIKKHQNALLMRKAKLETDKARTEIFPDYGTVSSMELENDFEVENLMNELQRWKQQNALARKADSDV